MAIKNAIYKVGNGTDFDEIMFKTTANQVVENSNKRFVSDSEKSTWNSKANGTHTHQATDVIESNSKRFVSDSEKSTWNSKAEGNHNHDSAYINKGSWSTNGGQDLLVYGKRALVGMTNGELHLGYGGDFSSIKCGNNHTIWHSGNFNPDSKSNTHDHPYIPTSASCNKNWNWNGQGGQPQWLWGGNDPNNMYVYNPSNFSVNYANSAENCNKIGGKRITISKSAPGSPSTGDIWISW